jgi:nucleoside 2-deoxyribosyltransferase
MAPRTIYLSSRTGRRDELLVAAADCEASGLVVASTWLHAEPVDPEDPAAAAAAAERDLRDLRTAEIFIGFTEPMASASRGRGGRHLELGVAVALNKQILLVGPEYEHIFHRIGDIALYPDWPTAREALVSAGG